MKKVPEFAACLQQAKEKISLNEPRKKKPNRANSGTAGEIEKPWNVREKRRKNSKSKRKVEETDNGCQLKR